MHIYVQIYAIYVHKDMHLYMSYKVVKYATSSLWFTLLIPCSQNAKSVLDHTPGPA